MPALKVSKDAWTLVHRGAGATCRWKLFTGAVSQEPLLCKPFSSRFEPILARFNKRWPHRKGFPILVTFARYAVKNLVLAIVQNLLYKINLNTFWTLLNFVQKGITVNKFNILGLLASSLQNFRDGNNDLRSFLARSPYKSLYVALCRSRTTLVFFFNGRGISFLDIKSGILDYFFSSKISSSTP